MKKTIAFIIYLLASMSMVAQQQEYIRLITDKECYLAGEDLWMKVCVSDANNQPMKISKVAYIEVSDEKQVYAQAKIDLTDGWGSGRIRLPRTMHSGTFLITAYTRYLRNWGEDAFCHQLIAVVNTLQASDEDCIAWIDSLPSLPTSISNKLSSDKQVYGKRSKVVLSWEEVPTDVFGLSLSVVRKDFALGGILQSTSYVPINHPQTFPWIAEIEGHIVHAALTDSTIQTQTSRLACVGKEVRMFEGKSVEDGSEYYFYTHGVNNMQDIVLDVVLKNETDKARLNIVTPFAESKAKQLPSIPLYSSEQHLL